MTGETIFKNDLLRIENDIIARQRNGKYMKFYKPLNAIVLLNMTQKQYMDYWINLYHNDYDKMQIIGQACIEKFENGLTDAGTMIELILNSKDKTKDRAEALRLLGVREVIDYV